MIGDAWASYLAEVVPADAPEVQREECKRAFYAGATAMYQAVMEAMEPTDEDACAARLTALHHELQGFVRLFLISLMKRTPRDDQHPP
ncbi:MAG TPA: hypothetical protein VK573_03010 [Gemmatimonadales bacterium]|nr:hypothetical protein [Gemmatimonadales bacterium]